MASTESTLLKYELQGDGDNSGTWGQVANAVFERIEESIADTVSLTLSSGTTVLSDTAYVENQSRKAILKLSGTLTGDCTIVIPDRSKTYFVVNNCTGNFEVEIKNVSGTGEVINNGSNNIFYCDGSNTIKMFSNSVNVTENQLRRPTEITLGTVTTGDTNTSNCKVTHLGGDVGVIVYRDDIGGNLKSVAYEAVGSDISFGTAVNVDTNLQDIDGAVDIVRVSNTSAAVFYSDADATNNGKMRMLTLSGLAITVNTESEFSNGNAIGFLSAVELNDTVDKFIVYYKDTTNLNRLTGVVVTLSGTTLTAGTPVQLNGSACGGSASIKAYRQASGTEQTCVIYSLTSQLLVQKPTISGTVITSASDIVIASSVYNTVNGAEVEDGVFTWSCWKGDGTAGQYYGVVEMANNAVYSEDWFKQANDKVSFTAMCVRNIGNDFIYAYSSNDKGLKFAFGELSDNVSASIKGGHILANSNGIVALDVKRIDDNRCIAVYCPDDVNTTLTAQILNVS